MKKQSKREYILQIAEELVKAYGNTLLDYNTDIELAIAVLKSLQPYLFFHPHESINESEFMEWRENILLDNNFELDAQTMKQAWSLVKKFKL